MNLEFRKNLGKQLAVKRKERNYTQEELARRLRITRPQLSDYETGRVVNPTFDVLRNAAEVLRTDLEVAGYRLTKLGPRRPEAKAMGQEKQLTFSFYKGRSPRDATIRVTTLRSSVIIHASVAAGEV
jgi:transcriptional regulator with XRE-family HTH domain